MNRKYILVGCIIAVVILSGLFIWNLDILNWKKLDISKIYDIELSTKIYDENGSEAALLSGTVSRTYVSLSKLPPHVYQAFIAAEDTRFYLHNGIDLRRIGGAVLANIKSGDYSQGASTITQQLIKLTHLSSEKTISRKVQEAFLAIQLERQLSKEQILEAYINMVYFGGGAYGIEAAAHRYFSKSAEELTVSESALLAGIIKSPTSYAPHNNMDAALKRRDYVLNSMFEEGYIDSDVLDEAKNSEIILNETRTTENYSWYIDMAASEACGILGINYEELLSGGYGIYTALDQDMQEAAESIMEDAATYPETAAQGAMIAVKPENGAVVAVVGGREYAARFGLNRATSAYRQPGSVIKPITTYAAAVEEYGYLPSDKVYDIKREYPGGYSPGNAGNSFYGETTMRRALSKSLNAATVDLADTIGIGCVAEYAQRFGLEINEEDRNLALALGSLTRGTTPAQMCAAYAALANGGILFAPHSVEMITDRTGKVIYKAAIEGKRAVSEETAFILTDMLATAATEGTAASLAELGIPVAAKTGTAGLLNGDTSDAWAIAFTPEITVAAWIGKDNNADGGMAKGVSGSGYAVPACRRFLTACRSDLSGKAFDIPEGLSRVLIDKYALENELRLVLASARTPDECVAAEVIRSAEGLQISDIWDVPEGVTDIQLISEAGEVPVIQFTGTNRYADYMIVRRCKGESETAGIIECAEGQTVRFMDTGADTAQISVYTIIPIHALLYEEGITLTGPESTAVQTRPDGILNGISSFFDGINDTSETETLGKPLF